ncbi:MAG: GNAT family N-acetyltransferase, partial [Methanomassiliicoccales archaeon]
PVSSLLIFTQGKIAGVQLVSTLPAQRGRGWASCLLVEALHIAREEGATDSVLEATKMGAGSYERIGFEGCGWSRYLSPPQRHNAD